MLAADMIAVPLGPRQRSAIVASPTFFERWPKPATPHDLKGIPCIRFRYEGRPDYKWEFERDKTKLEIVVDGPFATSSMDLMILAALDSLGVACVFESHVEDHLAAGRLVRVLEEWCPDYPGYYLYYPSRRHMPTALRALIDFMRQKSPEAPSGMAPHAPPSRLERRASSSSRP